MTSPREKAEGFKYALETFLVCLEFRIHFAMNTMDNTTMTPPTHMAVKPTTPPTCPKTSGSCVAGDGAEALEGGRDAEVMST
jgi:hypothetical protein